MYTIAHWKLRFTCVQHSASILHSTISKIFVCFIKILRVDGSITVKSIDTKTHKAHGKDLPTVEIKERSKNKNKKKITYWLTSGKPIQRKIIQNKCIFMSREVFKKHIHGRRGKKCHERRNHTKNRTCTISKRGNVCACYWSFYTWKKKKQTNSL